LNVPARLTAEQAAIELGFATHDIPFLIATKLLKPLQKTERNSVKYFAALNERPITAAVEFRLDQANRGRRGRISTACDHEELRGRTFSEQELGLLLCH